MPESAADKSVERAVGRPGEVVVVRNSDKTFTVFGSLKDLAEATRVTPQYAQVILAALGRPAGPHEEVGQRVFALRPEDYAWFDKARKMQAGQGFVRGTLLDSNGKITRQIGIKEVQGFPTKAPPVDPVALLVASQMASVQQQLTRIEDRLETLQYDVQRGIDILEREQSAEVAAAVRIVSEVFGSFARMGSVGSTDWARVVHLEGIILKRHVAVVDELETLANAFNLNGDLNHDKKVIDRVHPDRWEAMLVQETLLRRAELEWVALYSDRKRDEGLEDAGALEGIRERHALLAERAEEATVRILGIAARGAPTKQRSMLRQFLTDGVIVGGARDHATIRRLEKLCGDMSSAAGSVPSVGLDPVSGLTLRLTAEVPEESLGPAT